MENDLNIKDTSLTIALVPRNPDSTGKKPELIQVKD